ncbi:Sodium/sulfate symporter [Dimargaris cristalligena]|uniref:Sodium/sulfate symporter n=1 Tax=Dimargaris cristalligena TaxID=215637 RepID=A0A4P9ZRW7_9FUNG|nr:Sodium/sulfate symporter [Dimargaris cristalligena]|eukprot:RKP35511.1 Sodium/sulfate symporter [Dimargaris cristalligena]
MSNLTDSSRTVAPPAMYGAIPIAHCPPAHSPGFEPEPVKSVWRQDLRTNLWRVWDRFPLIRTLPVLLLVVGLWHFPYPAYLDPTGPRILSVYIGMIAAVMLTSYELSVIVTLALAFLIVTQNLQCSTPEGGWIACHRCQTTGPDGRPLCHGMEGAFQTAVSGFSNKINWLVFSAFHIGKAVMLSGLGQRIGFTLLRTMGGSALGIAYAFTLAEILLAPFVPSNTARGGGIIYPIVVSVIESLGVSHHTHPEMGQFVLFAAAQANLISSSFFITGMAGNPLLAPKAREIFGFQWDFGKWFLGNLLPGGIIALLMPLVVYRLFRPRIPPCVIRDSIEEQSQFVKPFSMRELKLCVILLGALVLWVTGPLTGIDSAVVAFLAFAALVVTRVLEWSDVLGNTTAWDTLFWLGSFIILAEQLNAFGITTWLGQGLSRQLTGLPPWPALGALSIIYVGTMYLFSSTTSHILALSSPLLMAAFELGCPAGPAVAMISYLSALGSCLTNYSTGTLVMYFSQDYISRGRWFFNGLVVLALYLTCYAVIGPFWWKLLGWY